MVPGRTKNQCCSRWKYTLDPGIGQGTGRTGQWPEDTKLKDAVQMHGSKNWVAISALVPGRFKKQCNQRWHDVLDPSIGRANGCTGEWSEDEDIKLENAVITHDGKDWAVLSTLVPGRTKIQWRHKWKIYMDANRSTVRELEHDTLNKLPALEQDRPFS
jgi:myb proto-oncogene protein